MNDLMTGRLRNAGRAMAAAARRPAGRAAALAAVLTAVAAVATITAAAAPPAMAATSAPHAERAPAAPESSKRFIVTNLSEYTLKLVKIDGNHGDKFEGRPDIGSTIAPGYSHIFEVVWIFLKSNKITAHYDVLDNGHNVGSLNAIMEVDTNPDLDEYEYSGCSTTGTGTCQVNFRTNTISFLSTAITHTIDNQTEQSDLLDQYCAGAPNFSCTFDPVSQQFTLGAPHQSGPAIANETDSDIIKKVTVTDKVTSSQNVELTVNAKVTVGKAFEAGVSKKYGHTQAGEHTYTEETTVTIKPHKKVWPEAEDPLAVYTGTFLIHLGNTTWDLENVAVSYPDPDGFPTITWKQADI